MARRVQGTAARDEAPVEAGHAGEIGGALQDVAQAVIDAEMSLNALGARIASVMHPVDTESAAFALSRKAPAAATPLHAYLLTLSDGVGRLRERIEAMTRNVAL